jgi:hypothetical protein
LCDDDVLCLAQFAFTHRFGLEPFEFSKGALLRRFMCNSRGERDVDGEEPGPEIDTIGPNADRQSFFYQGLIES